MRKIIVYNVISLDGYHTGSGNDVSVMFPMMGKVFDSYNAELLRTADVLLVGRVSFELFQSFWPKVAENPTSDEWTDSQRDLSQAGKSVKGKTLKAGTYRFVISDKSDFHNFTLEREKPKKPHFEFHITKTGFTGSKTKTITLKPGSWRFYCSIHEAMMHGDFKVTK